MANLSKFEAVAKSFDGIADFAMVYVAEAHPMEDKDFTFGHQLKDPKEVEERFENAQVLQDETDIPVYVDDMDDAACRKYGAYPERLYVVRDGTIVYQGGPGPMDYDVDDLEMWMEKNLRD